MSDELKHVKHETPYGQEAKAGRREAEVVDSTDIMDPPADAGNDAAEDALDAAQASGFAKLEKLGLTVDEINALFGVEAPAVKDARKKERRGKRKPKGAAKGTLRSAFETMTGKNK